MRISCEETSPNYWASNFRNCPLVTINGIRLPEVLYADDIEGLVVTMRYDDNGCPRLIEHRGRVCIEEIPHNCEQH